jgi:hypothetical protein
VTNKTITWNDPSLVTKDKQPIGMTLTLTYARAKDTASITNLYMQYRSEAMNDEALANLVNSRVPEVAKSISANYSLDEMLGISPTVTRDAVSSQMEDMLRTKLKTIYIDLVSVQLNDIAASQSYMDMLNQKAAAQLQVELAKQQTLTLAEQLKQTEAQNRINLSVAVNANEVAAESAKALKDPQLFRLKQLEALAKVFGPNAKVVFIPEGTALDIVNMDGNGNGQVIPIPAP